MNAELLTRASRPNVIAGRGTVRDAAPASGSYVLVAQAEPIAARARLRTPPVDTWIVASLDEDALTRMVEALRPADYVVGLGGGMAMDAAKFVAWRRGVPLRLVPSIVSVDASVTNTVAIRRGGRVVYDGFVVAEAIVVDYDLIRTAPPLLNRAGIGDLLSIHTGLWDWELGDRRGKAEFRPEAAARSAAILDRIEQAVDDIRGVTDVGIDTIIRGYIDVNAINLAAGHSQAEEGSEHYFAYHLEAVVGHGFVHGSVVGLGTVLMAQLQDNDPERPRRILAAAGVDRTLAGLSVTRGQLHEALATLPTYVRGAGLPYSVIDEPGLLDAHLDELMATAIAAG